MVRLAILPHRGNQNRAFPYTGYLGLTPVSVQGYVRTELEEDNLSLEASHVQVRLRCYECEGRGTHTAKSSNVRVLYEVSKRLWAASAGQEHGALGDFEAKFRLTVPVDATLHGALSSMHFKTWRIWWALEAGQSPHGACAREKHANFWLRQWSITRHRRPSALA
jgi:hypothetical protein